MKRSRLFVLGSMAALGWVVACAKPTQARVRISLRDLPCATPSGPTGISLTDFVIYVGKSLDEVNEREENHVVAASLDCSLIDDNTSLVLYPASDTLRAVVRVVGGTSKLEASGKPRRIRAEQCTIGAPGDCLRATRAFEYVQNETVDLPVVLDSACVGLVCPNGSTCDSGVCLPADCEKRSDCAAPGKNRSTVDAAVRDAASASDADVPQDAGPDAAVEPRFDFKCSNGSPEFKPPIAPCLGARPFCYDPTSGASACGNATNKCEAGTFQPCCGRTLTNEGVYDRTCCLSAISNHPIELGPLIGNGNCSTKELCFLGETCSGGSKCFQVGSTGWGICGTQQ